MAIATDSGRYQTYSVFNKGLTDMDADYISEQIKHYRQAFLNKWILSKAE